MNHFGRLFQLSIYGESHGGGVGVVVDGVRPGIEISEADFQTDLSRRKSGGLGTTPRIEPDQIIIDSGIFNGCTTGAPISLRFLNTNTNSKDYSNLVKHPRPSHADFVAKEKYDSYNDYRGGGHFSGRITLGLVSAGVIAKKILEDVSFETKLINLGGETDPSKFQEKLIEAVKNKDSVGGIVTIRIKGVPVGYGEPFFDSLESTISHLLFSVGGVKGVEFGTGFNGINMKGSEFNDLIINANGKTKTNNNGGINGGISNGNDIIINVFVKPTASIGVPQDTYNFEHAQIEELIVQGRHDAAIVLRAMVVLEACCAIALADAKLINDTLVKKY